MSGLFQYYGSTRLKALRKETEWSENLDGFSSLSAHTYSNEEDPLVILWELLDTSILLALIGCFSALISFLTSAIVERGDLIRWSLVGSASDPIAISIYCSYCVFMALVACTITQNICREASGGGLAEMKTILSGIVKPILLSKRLIFAKSTGLIFSLLAGLSIGKEGPYVQISAAIADQLMQFGIFNRLKLQDSKRLEIIGCACASGVASTFGTLFGGILFSIELTSSAYIVKNLPKAFLTSLCAILMFHLLKQNDQLPFLDNVSTSLKVQITWKEIFGFIVIGLFFGILGVIFICFVEQLTHWKNKILNSPNISREISRLRHYILVASVTLIVSLLMYFEIANNPIISTRSHTLLDNIFQQNDLSASADKLLLCFPYKFIVTALSVVLPLPVGLFTPVFFTGGVFGRVIGEFLQNYSGFENFGPWDYALIGGAAFTTGVTRAISTAIIVYELSGQKHIQLPLAVSILSAYFIGNRFSKNVFEVLIDFNGSPYLKELPKNLYAVPVSEIMIPIDPSQVLALDSTYQDAMQIVDTESCDSFQFRSPHRNIYKTELSPSIGISPLSSATLKAAGVENSYPSSSATTSTLPSTLSDTNALKDDIESSYLQDVNHNLQEYNKNLEQKLHKSSLEILHNLPIIPIVQSKQSMVIVGAVLREDVRIAIYKLVEMSSLISTSPIVLGLNHEQSGPSLPNVNINGLKRSSRGRINKQPSQKRQLNVNEFETDMDEYETEDGPDDSMQSNLLSIAITNQKLQEFKSIRRHFSYGDMEANENSFLLPTKNLSTNEENHLRIITAKPYSIHGDKDKWFIRSKSNPESKKYNPPPKERKEGRIHELLRETIQYILVTHGGKTVVPVALSKNSFRKEKDHRGRRSISKNESLRGSHPNQDSRTFLWNSLPLAIPIDPSPYQVVDTMHLNKVDMVFRMLSLNQAYVTNSGRLTGVITRSSLHEYLRDKIRKPYTTIIQFCRACYHKCFCFNPTGH